MIGLDRNTQHPPGGGLLVSQTVVFALRRSWGCGGRTTSSRGAGGGSGSTEKVENSTTSRSITRRLRPSTSTSRRPGSRSQKAALFQKRGPVGSPADGPGARAAGGPGDDQSGAPRPLGCRPRRAATRSGATGIYGVLVERWGPSSLTTRRRTSAGPVNCRAARRWMKILARTQLTCRRATPILFPQEQSPS